MAFAFATGLNLGQQPDFLPPDIKAMYEAGFGVMAINADWSTADPPLDMKRTLNHETYHHLQTVCSGFAWQRGHAVSQIAFRHMGRASLRMLSADPGWKAASVLLSVLPEALRRRIDAARWERMIAFMMSNNALARLANAADPDDPSLAAAEMPGLFAELDGLDTALWEPGEDGLADGHVVEGSAVAHGVLVEAAARAGPHILCDASAAELDDVMAQMAAPYGPQYTTLLDAARGRGPASLFLLPAAALALCYERPGRAFLPLLDTLRGTASAEALTHARSLVQRPPALPAAGRFLGTARQASGWRARRWPLQPWRRKTSGLHRAAFAELDRNATDEVAILSDPLGFDAIPTPMLCAVARYNDRAFGVGGMSTGEAAVRLGMAGLVVRAQTRRGAERANEAELRTALRIMLDGIGQ